MIFKLGPSMKIPLYRALAGILKVGAKFGANLQKKEPIIESI